MAKTRRSVQTAPDKVSSPSNNKSTVPAAATNQGFFLNAANWLLSRLPWFNQHYQNWSKTKRIIIGFLMYLIVLPVIPVVIGIILFIRDPEGFRSGKSFKILGAVTLLWLGAFGLISTQPSVPDNPLNSTAKVTQYNTEQRQSPEASKTDNSDAKPASERSKQHEAIQNDTKSAASKGRFFKNCDAAFAAHVFNIHKSDPAYQSRLDRDHDGIACEK